MKIKAVLFDLDGTLRDTREIIYPALEHAVRTHSKRVPSREEMADYVHHHTEVHRAFASDVPFSVFEATYRDKINELMPNVQSYDGVNEVLATLHAAGYHMAIVSSANSLVAYADKAGIAQYFEAFVNGNETEEHKPHPAPVLLALEKLQVKAEHTVMVGDLAADMQAAGGAGVAGLIGISHGFGTAERLTAAGADYVIDSLTELPDILATIEQK